MDLISLDSRKTVVSVSAITRLALSLTIFDSFFMYIIFSQSISVLLCRTRTIYGKDMARTDIKLNKALFTQTTEQRNSRYYVICLDRPQNFLKATKIPRIWLGSPDCSLNISKWDQSTIETLKLYQEVNFTEPRHGIKSGVNQMPMKTN